MFTRDGTGNPTVRIFFDGAPIDAPQGESVAAALLGAGILPERLSAVSGASRAPYCMMGICFECLVIIDGRQSSQACMTPVQDGMRIESQRGGHYVGPF